MQREQSIGHRIRERRVARRQSLRAVAELAGLSESYLSRIERGQRPVDRRSTLEALAAALQVSPTDLTDGWHVASTEADAEVYGALVALRVALADSALGDPAIERARPWPELAALLDRINADMRPRNDYAALGVALPEVIPELHVVATGTGEHREVALRGLVDCYSAACFAAKNLGDPALAHLAALHARDAADALGDPAEVGRAAWLRAQAISSPARERTLALSRRAADDLQHDLDAAEVREVYGMLHLTAALAAAALRRDGDSADHLAEAADVAERVGDCGAFGNLYFGRANLGIWRVTLAVERGDGGRVVELARGVDPALVPSRGRQASFYADLGRGLASERRTRPQAVAALRRAEELAPQRVRANPFVRETVTDLMRRAPRDGGAELRGLAYRMGVAV